MPNELIKQSAKILPVTWASDFGSRVLWLACSAKSGSIKPMGGGIEIGESPILGAQRETFEESNLIVSLARLIFLGKFLEKTSAKGKYPIGTKIINYWYFLALDATEIMIPGDDVREYVPCSYEGAAKLLTHKNTAKIYRTKLLPQLKRKYLY